MNHTKRLTNRHLDLQEWRTSKSIALSISERDDLRHFLDSIEPAADREDVYILTPGSKVGAFEIGDLSVSIQPKLDIGRVLYLASYALGAEGAVDFRRERFDYQQQPTLTETLVPAPTRGGRGNGWRVWGRRR